MPSHHSPKDSTLQMLQTQCSAQAELPNLKRISAAFKSMLRTRCAVGDVQGMGERRLSSARISQLLALSHGREAPAFGIGLSLTKSAVSHAALRVSAPSGGAAVS